MDLIDKILMDLATSFGLPSLAFNDRGVVALSVGDLGELQIARWREDGLTVALFRDADERRFRAMLAACGPAGEHPWPVSAGAAERGKAGFVMRLPSKAMSLVEVERCIAHMDGLFKNLGK